MTMDAGTVAGREHWLPVQEDISALTPAPSRLLPLYWRDTESLCCSGPCVPHLDRLAGSGSVGAGGTVTAYLAGSAPSANKYTDGLSGSQYPKYTLGIIGRGLTNRGSGGRGYEWFARRDVREDATFAGGE